MKYDVNDEWIKVRKKKNPFIREKKYASAILHDSDPDSELWVWILHGSNVSSLNDIIKQGGIKTITVNTAQKGLKHFPHNG